MHPQLRAYYWSFLSLSPSPEQEQTKFDDLRRGITKDFKDWQSFKGLCQKTKKITDFKRSAFLTFFDLQMTSKLKFDLIHPT